MFDFLDNVYLCNCGVTFCIEWWTNQHSAFSVLVCDWSNACVGLDPLPREMNYLIWDTVSSGLLLELPLKPRCVTRELLSILQKVSYENTLVLHLVYMNIYICISVYWCHWEILCQHRFQYRFVARWCELITRLSSPWCRNWHWQRIHMRHYVEAYSDSNKITNTLES